MGEIMVCDVCGSKSDKILQMGKWNFNWCGSEECKKKIGEEVDDRYKRRGMFRIKWKKE